MRKGYDRPIASSSERPAPADRGMRAALFLKEVARSLSRRPRRRGIVLGAALLAAALSVVACASFAVTPEGELRPMASGEPIVRPVQSDATPSGEPVVSPYPSVGSLVTTTVEGAAEDLLALEWSSGQQGAEPLDLFESPLPVPDPLLVVTASAQTDMAEAASTEAADSALLGAALANGESSAAAADAPENESAAEPTSAPPTEPAADAPAVEPTLAITEALQALVPAPITIEPSVPAPASTPEPSPSPAQSPQTEPVFDGVERSLRVPVLMYHYLSTPPVGADAYRRDLSVTPDLFAAHLDRLAADGYTTISPYALMAALMTGASLPEKPVLITFDDGYRDNYENALPLLRDRGMVATFFVVTDFLDENRPEYLTWDMAREMKAAGMAIESHGRNHATLMGRDTDYLVWQALGSLETIQFELGDRPRFVSYPAGEYDANTLALFESAGYWGGFTTVQGATHGSSQRFTLPRVRVRGTTSADDLARLLALDW